MRNVALVIKHEIVTTLKKPVFWITTFVLPLIIMAFTFGSQIISTQMLEEEAPLLEATAEAPGEEGEAPPSEGPLAIGYVDSGDLIQALPEGIPEELVVEYETQEAAQTALEAGEINQYYVIPADYVASGDILVVDREFSPLGNIATVDLFHYIVDYNLLGDAPLATRISNPVERLESTAVEIEETATSEADQIVRFFVAYAVLFIFFMVLSMSSGFMLRSVSTEKENRTVEILLSSLRPRDLMLGKVIGLGAVALLQIAIWIGGSVLFLNQGGPLLSALGDISLGGFSLPPGFTLWALAYFLLGYLLYSSLLGAIGALAPNAREASQFTFVALLPMMLPLWFVNVFASSPHGALATALSLFPLSAPTAMLPRLVSGGVPLWQPIVGLLLLLGTAYLFVLASARFFRADTLLSDASLGWERMQKELRRAFGR